MRSLRLMLLSLPLILAAAIGHATTGNDLTQIGVSGSGGGTQLLLGYRGTASYGCSDGSVRAVFGDGSVRTVSGEPLGDNPPPCNGSTGGEVLGDGPLPCEDGSVRFIGSGGLPTCNDGSVRGFFGDGSVRFVSVDPGSTGAFCFSNVGLPGGITDGTSNTIAFGEGAGLRIIPGYQAPSGSVRSIADGTSNTILIGETPASGFCLGNTIIDDPLLGDITDGTSNTIVIGDNSRFDVCFARARIGRISDGTSNTILFGDEQSNVCLEDVGADLAAAVSEPAPLVLLLPGILGIGIVLGRYRQL